jgi:predicted methyltransferase
VDAYHEFTVLDAMLAKLREALRPGGRLGILETSDALGKGRPEYQRRHRLPPELLIEDVARRGFRLQSFEPDFARRPGEASQYLAVFLKEGE